MNDIVIGDSKRAKSGRGSKFAPIAIPMYEWASAEVNSYPSWLQTLVSIEGLKGRVDITTLGDSKLLIVEPYSVEKRVSWGR